MNICFGCELTYDLPQPLPMIAMLNTHYSLVSFLEVPDKLVTTPAVPIESYRDSFGNWCSRLVAPSGRFVIGTEGVVVHDGLADTVDRQANEHTVETLPPDALMYLLGSRYCETDMLTEEAWRLFGDMLPGASRVQAICDFVHGHVAFGYEYSNPTRTASETYGAAHGVCRDFTHLAITFCRCLNIPARYCTGYVSDIGQPPPHPPMDFAAWMEVYLGGHWHMYDPRNNSPRIGRILIARGRDAADVPLAHTFGPNTLNGFRVWIDEM